LAFATPIDGESCKENEWHFVAGKSFANSLWSLLKVDGSSAKAIETDDF
jgi:hypothetical protein